MKFALGDVGAKATHSITRGIATLLCPNVFHEHYLCTCSYPNIPVDGLGSQVVGVRLCAFLDRCRVRTAFRGRLWCIR